MKSTTPHSYPQKYPSFQLGCSLGCGMTSVLLFYLHLSSSCTALSSCTGLVLAKDTKLYTLYYNYLDYLSHHHAHQLQLPCSLKSHGSVCCKVCCRSCLTVCCSWSRKGRRRGEGCAFTTRCWPQFVTSLIGKAMNTCRMGVLEH